MKKLTSIILCISILLMLPLATIYSNAETETDESPTTPAYIMGDLDNNQKITATDARICLRASAKLIELTEEEKQAADVLNDGEVTAADARKILRVSARLEKFEIVLQVGQSYVLPPLKNAGSGMYNWRCSQPSIGLEWTSETINPWEGTYVVGGPSETTFTFSAQIPGTYDISLILIASWEKTSINDLSFTIKVEDVDLNVGESYALPALSTPVSGMLDWFCEITPTHGIALTSDIVYLDSLEEDEVRPMKTYYTFLAETPGTYTVTLSAIAVGESASNGISELIEEITFKIVVKE